MYANALRTPKKKRVRLNAKRQHLMYHRDIKGKKRKQE